MPTKKKKKKPYHLFSVLFLSILVGVFLCLGTCILGDIIASVLPSKDTNIQLTGSEIRLTTSGLRNQGGSSYVSAQRSTS